MGVREWEGAFNNGAQKQVGGLRSGSLKKEVFTKTVLSSKTQSSCGGRSRCQTQDLEAGFSPFGDSTPFTFSP